MEVYFDFELRDGAEQPDDVKNVGLETMRTFIISRFKVIEEELDATRPRPESSAAIVIEMDAEGFGLRRINIAESMAEKFNACFTYDDAEYLVDFLGRIKDEL